MKRFVVTRGYLDESEYGDLVMYEDAIKYGDREFERGATSCLLIRCVEHREVPPYNHNEASGAECAACAVEAERASAAERAIEREREIRGLVNQKWVRKEDYDALAAHLARLDADARSGLFAWNAIQWSTHNNTSRACVEAMGRLCYTLAATLAAPTPLLPIPSGPQPERKDQP